MKIEAQADREQYKRALENNAFYDQGYGHGFWSGVIAAAVTASALGVAAAVFWLF